MYYQEIWIYKGWAIFSAVEWDVTSESCTIHEHSTQNFLIELTLDHFLRQKQMQVCWLLSLPFKTRTWVSAKHTQTSWKIIPLVFWTLVFFPVASVILSEVVEHKSFKLKLQSALNHDEETCIVNCDLCVLSFWVSDFGFWSLYRIPQAEIYVWGQL